MQILVAGGDGSLSADLPQWLASHEVAQAVVRREADLYRAAEAARVWHADVVLLQVSDDFEATRLCVRDIRTAAPHCSVVAVLRNDLFDGPMSEGEFLIQAVRWGVKDFLRWPLARDEFQAVWERLSQSSRSTATSVGRLVSFISNKGGVGKTTLAVNTAVELARRFPERVLLIDCSLQMGVCAPTLHLRPASSIVDAARERQRLDETLLRQLAVPHESGLDLLAAPSDAIEATEVSEDTLVRLLAIARRAYDFVIVDTFPMFDRFVMSVLDVSDRTFIVTDNLVPTVLGVAQLLKVLDNLGYPAQRQALVANRVVNILGSLGEADIERRLGRELAHVVPFDKRVITAANIGRPFVLSKGWFAKAQRRMKALADEIAVLSPAGDQVESSEPPRPSAANRAAVRDSVPPLEPTR